MGMKRVTQRDVAARAGVSRSAVSLALQGHASIPEETRRRIREAAETLGYVADPFLSGLVAYRNQNRSAAFRGVLAWVVNKEGHPFPWRRSPHYLDYFNGAGRRARHHGYELEEMAFQPSGGTSAARLAGILRARNISGILLCPQPRADTVLDFPLEGFSAVTFGYSLASPHLRTVAAAHYLNTRRAMQVVRARGYRRVGMLLDPDINRRLGSNIHAGYLIEQANCGDSPIPALFDYHTMEGPSADNARNLARYISEHGLDAVVTSDYRVLETMSLAGLSAPRDLGVAGICLPVKGSALSGVVEDSELIGSVAVDQLVSMIQQGERGVPPASTRIHLEGVWHEGSSLCPGPGGVMG